MKLFKILCLVIVTIFSFIACGEQRTSLSVMDKPVELSLFQPEVSFVALKDSEKICEGMGRVLVERIEKESPNYARYAVLVVPYRTIRKGEFVIPKRITFISNGQGESEHFLIVE